MDICLIALIWSRESWKEYWWRLEVHCKVVAASGARDAREAEAHEGRAQIGYKGTLGGWI
jgi:hypothetical protein